MDTPEAEQFRFLVVFPRTFTPLLGATDLLESLHTDASTRKRKSMWMKYSKRKSANIT
jgi:hypothetical protein